MSSNINPSTIDATYPIAGQDNDTQGFRNNFNFIKNNFLVAATEISTIQSQLAQKYTIVSVPAASSSPGTAGQIAYDSTYLYVCVATDTWVKIPNLNTLAAFTGNINVTGNVTASNITANTVTVSSTLKLANLTTAQVANISTVSRGMMVYNYSTGNVQVYNGTKWGNVTIS